MGVMAGRIHPFEIPAPSEDLEISFLLDNYGQLLELNREPYRLAADSFQESSQVLRRQELTNPFVDGTYLASYTRDNVTESLSVWVSGADHAQLNEAVSKLCRCFEQYVYSAVYRVNHLVRTWTCLASDYSVQVQHAYLHARIAQVRATLVRLPTEQISEWGI